jgi:transposase-like protein
MHSIAITAGHKGYSEVVAGLGRRGRRRNLRGQRGRCTLEGERPPVLGLLRCNGEVVIQMVLNVQHVTIKPLITQTIAPEGLIYTDEYEIYDSLSKWGYQHKSVNHAAGENARDEDGAPCMASASMESTPTPSKVFGRYCALGCVGIVDFPKKRYPCIWAFSSSSTMFVAGAKRCSTRF